MATFPKNIGFTNVEVPCFELPCFSSLGDVAHFSHAGQSRCPSERTLNEITNGWLKVFRKCEGEDAESGT